MVRVYGCFISPAKPSDGYCYSFFRRKNRKNKCKEVYLFAQRCIYSKNKVYRFDELIHFLNNSLVIYTKKLNFAN